MSFQLVPKSVTLNDLERRNGPYFALFHRIRVRCRCNKFTFAILSPDEFLVCFLMHWRKASRALVLMTVVNHDARYKLRKITMPS